MPVPIVDNFREELARLDLLIHREILRLRATYQLSLDEYRGIYISDEQVDALVAKSKPLGDIADPIAKLTRDAEEIAERIGDDSPVARIARTLELDGFARDVLLVAVAPELQLKYETLYAYLNNHASRPFPTIDLALRLCGRGRDDRACFTRLFREGILERSDAGTERGSELGRAFAIAPALAAAMQGLPPFDARLAEWVEPVGAPDVPLPTAVTAPLTCLSEMLARTAEPPIVLLQAELGQSTWVAARHLLQLLSRDTLRVHGTAVPERPPLATLTLVARLRGDGAFIDADDWATEVSQRVQPRLLSLLWRARVPVIVGAASRTDAQALLRELPVLRLCLREPDASERRILWTRALDRAQLAAPARAVDEVAEHFRLGPLQITGAVRVLAASGAELGRERLFDAARDQSSGQVGCLATRVPQRHQFSDLVLPPFVLRRLHEVLGAIRARAKVFGDWGFGHRGGRGLMVLFAGSSGTGKTMSASVLSREIGLELYQIDLAGVVSKYIGETEKNLDRIFEAARMANVILFFDEADALMGRRSEVKDAHDRYANIEVAYLLQKMEEHDGVVILASNLSKNMDQAFARRMHYVVEFPRPDATLREKLWQCVFPSQVPIASDVDFAFLGRQFDLAGGDIKTIALDAAFLAASHDRPVAMTDLVGAVSRQMLKQGRPLGASDFKHYHGGIVDGVAS
jgi:hypothetical protein